MISLVLYGRNDAHGYNLHRRAALSLNCLAEVLTDPDDEIVFVDYNTPDELPTFVEALADTLTGRCLDRLRVVRIPAALHRKRFAALTHLPVVEPVCRNAAVRRANPANRWLLSTNTDMIFIPRSAHSLSEICGDLADGYYGLPRFELPEWLWERLPRSDPSTVLAELGRLGPRLHLDEPTLSHEWIRFDAPGDFQLCLRDDFVAIDGFDEEMLLGWHVDSNFSRRMFIHRGSIGSLQDDVAGYHCNHSRIPTIYHGPSDPANDLTRFFESVEHAELPAQRATWGLADAALEEVSIRGRVGVRFADALASAIPPPERPKGPSHADDALFGLTYDSRHVFSFVADSIAVSPPGVSVGYVGRNSALEEMLLRLADELGFELFTSSDSPSFDRLAQAADLVVIDFGLDSAGMRDDGLSQQDLASRTRRLAGLRSVMEAFERLVDHERSRLELGEHPRRFVLVQSTSHHTNAYVLSQLDCSHTSTHSRVRRATVKQFGDEGLHATLDTEPLTRELSWAESRMRWDARLDEPEGRLRLPTNRTVPVGELEEFLGFGTGWAIPDAEAIWTQGTRAKLAIELDETPTRKAFFAMTFGRVGAWRDESLLVRLLIDGTATATRSFAGGTRRVTWRVEIPSGAIARRAFDVALEFETPRAWLADDRRLGLHLRSLGVEQGVVARWVREDIDRLRVALRALSRGLGVRRPRTP